MITLLHPSRSRPEKAYQTAKKWIENAGVEVEYILSLDYSDDTLKYDVFHFESLTAQTGTSFPVKGKITFGYVLISDNISVVEATNKAAAMSKGDILVYLSDDFDCFPNWGVAVEKEFINEDRPLLIKVDDCLQKFEVPVLTIPIMNRKLYEKLGYFWHPEYKSMFVDEDLFWTSKRLGALKMCPNLKFEHQHVCVGKAQDDETYRRSSKNWDQGKALFAQRKAAGFPL